MDEYAMEQDYMRSKGIDPAPIATISEQLMTNVGDNATRIRTRKAAAPIPPRAPVRKTMNSCATTTFINH
jgi:hypothetical protein